LTAENKLLWNAQDFAFQSTLIAQTAKLSQMQDAVMLEPMLEQLAEAMSSLLANNNAQSKSLKSFKLLNQSLHQSLLLNLSQLLFSLNQSLHQSLLLNLNQQEESTMMEFGEFMIGMETKEQI